MKIVEATWETRNLGMKAWEVILSAVDLKDVTKLICKLRDSRFDKSYVCVKLPVGNLKAVHALEDEGFRFLETQMKLKSCFGPSPLFEHVDCVAETVETKTIDKIESEWLRICDMITPSMFVTDRIALDPAFGPEIACRRYRNWIMDSYRDPDMILSVTVADGHEVAFGLDRIDDGGRKIGVLGGVFDAYRESGFGTAALLGRPSSRVGRGKYKTVISSNNIGVVRVHQNCGRIIYDELYVLRKIFP